MCASVQPANATHRFENWEIPVAYSMLDLAREASSEHRTYNTFQRYICYWVAFNNIYTTIGEREGRVALLRRDSAGNLQTEQIAGISFYRVDAPRERDLLDLAFTKFTDALKITLAEHESTAFFLNRRPKQADQEIPADAFGQVPNGVLNIGYSLNGYPRYSPVSQADYSQYAQDKNNVEACDRLAKQVLNITYTVRNNLFHGGKRTDDGNAQEVVENAFPLLRLIVLSFLKDHPELY